MGFFYQAIKKATGQPEEEPGQERSQSQELEATATALMAPEKVSQRAVAAAAATGTASAVAERPRKSRQSFEVQHPVQNLVAFLTHPVLEPNIAAMEQCRVIRTRLRDIMRAKKMRTVMMTSSTAGEGKTLLSVNLAYALSQIEGMKILLVDADMRRPAIKKFLRMRSDKGLGTYLKNGDPFDDVCWRITPSLDVVPTSELSDDAAELLHGARMHQFLAEARAEYDIVLFDGPPLFPIVDAQVLGNMVDAAVLVVRANATPYDLAAQSAELLNHKFIGSILNRVDHLSQSGYYGYGTYGKDMGKNVR